jgi:transposase-like protein
MAADWDLIKTEYITTDITCRKLAEKHGVSESTLFKKCSKERWEASRKQHGSKLEAKILQKDINKRADIAVARSNALMEAADLLLEKTVRGINSAPIVTPTAAKNYSDALKNIKEIHMIRTAEDIEEQRARIAKLRKDTEKADTDSQVTVIIEGDKSYGE